MERGLRVPGKVLGPGGKAGGVRRRPSAFSWRKETVGAAPHLRGSSDYLAGPSGSQGRGQRVGTGGWTERGGAGRRAPAFPLRSSQVTVPAGSCPAPPRRIFRRPPAASESSQRWRRPEPLPVCARVDPRARPPANSPPAMAAAADRRSLLTLLQVLGLALAQIVSPAAAPTPGPRVGVWGSGSRSLEKRSVFPASLS